MSDTNHIIYTLISYALTFVLLILFDKKICEEKGKNIVLKIFALATVGIHYSSLYVDFFKNGEAIMEDTMLLPIYPCNVAMWLLLICAFYKNKDSKIFKHIAVATFYLGLIGGSIGLIFNENYISDPNLLNWDVLKGLLSHSTLVFGSIYLLAGGYVSIRVKNIISVIGCLLGLLLDGVLIIGIHLLFKLDPPNCMYLLENPFPEIPWFNSVIIGVLAVLLVFIITALYEQITLEKEERWYTKLHNKLVKREC